MSHTTLYLIRHGEVAWEIDPQKGKIIYGSDIHLSDIGEKNIQKVGSILQSENISKIYASPYYRTQQTAQILSALWRSVPIVTRENLRDIHFPGWIGLPWTELEKVNYDVYSHPRSADQETFKQLVQRMRIESHFVVQHEQGEKIALVGHGDPLSLLAYMLLNPQVISPSHQAFDSLYLQRSEAMRIVLDREGKVLEHTLFQPQTTVLP